MPHDVTAAELADLRARVQVLEERAHVGPLEEGAAQIIERLAHTLHHALDAAEASPAAARVAEAIRARLAVDLPLSLRWDDQEESEREPRAILDAITDRYGREPDPT